MMNFFLWGLLFTLTSALFQFSFQLSTVARTFESLDRTLAQSAVVALEEETNPSRLPYFDATIFEDRVKEHFETALGRSSTKKDYSLTFLYLAFRVRSSDGVGSCPYKIQVGFACDIASLYAYQNQKLFSIIEGGTYVA
jgi:hypothetical protein